MLFYNVSEEKLYTKIPVVSDHIKMSTVKNDCTEIMSQLSENNRFHKDSIDETCVQYSNVITFINGYVHF